MSWTSAERIFFGENVDGTSGFARVSPSGRTVPQIYIDDFHVGGYDDLVALDHAGGLAPLLAGKPGEREGRLA